MRYLIIAAVLSLTGCAAPTKQAVRSDVGSFAARDYLKTAYETLVAAETDTGGHRIRAQLETRAAIASLGEELAGPARLVPFEGPPTMRVALELLERSETQLPLNAPARKHALVAVAELRAALK